MKKITLLFFAIISFAFIQAQTNILENPGFETWTDGKPAPWYVVSATVTGSVVSQDASNFNEGANSFKVDAKGASGAVNWAQVVTVTPGKTYTLSMSYYIAEGDGTDARIWCNFKSATSFFTEAELVATGLFSKLRGPGNENSSGSAYFPDEKGAWKTYTIEFTVPSNAASFDFQFRTYKTAVVYWDKMSLMEKTTGTANISENSFKAIVSGKTLKVENVINGTTIEIFSSIGNKVLSTQLENGTISLNSIPKGLYIVRVGKETQKIML